MNFVRQIWEDWKAARRGEKRTAPAGATGRGYQKHSSRGALSVKSTRHGTISARVYRADTGT